MKTNYLLPNKYKTFGWILFSIGILLGIYLIFNDYEVDLLNITVIEFYNNDTLFEANNGFFKTLENSMFDELVAILIIVGGLIVGFSNEKIEDEFIYKLRKDSLVWSIIFNYIILILTILFVYGYTFFDILVFNMFTPLIFFIVRFNFLKFKSRNHEE